MNNILNIDYITPSKIQKILGQFDHLDWTNEPTESWKDLLKERAQQLRDTHDYIVLHYSGGSDSETVLNAFLDNGIFIDEIVNCYYDIPNAPCVNGVKPKTDLITKNFTGYFNRIEITYQDVLNYITTDNLLSDGPKFAGHLHNICRFNIQLLEAYGFAKKPIKRIGKICYLYGEMDPDVLYWQDEWVARFTLRQRFFNPCFLEGNEHFFTSINFPKLHLKQCHMVKTYMKNNPDIKWSDVKNKITRDTYFPLISPQKSGCNPKFLIKHPEVYSETNVILQNFIEKDPLFKDRFVNSFLKFQFKTFEKIERLSTTLFTVYKLDY